MKKELEDNILKIAETIENSEVEFDGGDSGYYFQRIKEKLYGLKIERRLKNIEKLFSFAPIGYKNCLSFRDCDFRFWKEDVKPEIIQLDFDVNEILGLPASTKEDNKIIEEKEVLIIHDCDICIDDNYLVIIKYLGYCPKIITVLLTKKQLDIFRKNNFKYGYGDLRDEFHVMKYEYIHKEVEKAYATEKKINMALFWIDSAIMYMEDSD